MRSGTVALPSYTCGLAQVSVQNNIDTVLDCYINCVDTVDGDRGQAGGIGLGSLIAVHAYASCLFLGLKLRTSIY